MRQILISRQWRLVLGVLVVIVFGIAVPPSVPAATTVVNGPKSEVAAVVFPEARAGTDTSRPDSYPFLPSDVGTPTTPSRTANLHPVGMNLAARRPYTVTTTTPDVLWRQQEMRYPDLGQLTDERLGTLSFTDSAWAGYQYQYVHDITVDLCHPATIRAIALDCLQNLGAGVIFPDDVRYYGSQDGVRFTLMGTVKKPNRTFGRQRDFRPQSYAFELSNVHFNARYVRAEFTNKVWAFMDEFAVYGWPGVDAKAAFPTVDESQGRMDEGTHSGYAKATQVSSDGIRNMLLVYTHGHGALGDWRTNDFLPMVRGPIKQRSRSNRQTKKPLFDTVMFTPYRITTSSTAWGDWLDDLFSKGKQLDALDRALDHVQERRRRRPVTSISERVVVTIPAIHTTGKFQLRNGEYDLSTTRLHPEEAVEAREAIVEWYLQQLMVRWHAHHYRHLQLVGICWQPESLSVVDEIDREIVQFCSEKVHERHLRFVWIPFYGAVGASDWKTLGFDLAILQPNVSFQWHADPMKRFWSAARFAKQHGLGIEMEAHWDVTSKYRQFSDKAQSLYFAYFAAAREFGFDQRDVVKAWYMNSKTLLTAANSKDPYYRRVYTETVRFLEDTSRDDG